MKFYFRILIKRVIVLNLFTRRTLFLFLLTIACGQFADLLSSEDDTDRPFGMMTIGGDDAEKRMQAFIGDVAKWHERKIPFSLPRNLLGKREWHHPKLGDFIIHFERESIWLESTQTELKGNQKHTKIDLVTDEAGSDKFAGIEGADEYIHTIFNSLAEAYAADRNKEDKNEDGTNFPRFEAIDKAVFYVSGGGDTATKIEATSDKPLETLMRELDEQRAAKAVPVPADASHDTSRPKPETSKLRAAQPPESSPATAADQQAEQVASAAQAAQDAQAAKLRKIKIAEGCFGAARLALVDLEQVLAAKNGCDSKSALVIGILADLARAGNDSLYFAGSNKTYIDYAYVACWPALDLCDACAKLLKLIKTLKKNSDDQMVDNQGIDQVTDKNVDQDCEDVADSEKIVDATVNPVSEAELGTSKACTSKKYRLNKSSNNIDLKKAFLTISKALPTLEGTLSIVRAMTSGEENKKVLMSLTLAISLIRISELLARAQNDESTLLNIAAIGLTGVAVGSAVVQYFKKQAV